MARGEKLKQSQVMIQAAESGMAGRQRAHETLLNTEAQGRRDMTSAAMQLGSLAEQGERRKLQEDQSNRDRTVREDIASAEIQGRNIDRQVNAADKGIENVGTVDDPIARRRQETEAEMARGAEQTGAAEEMPPAAPGGAGPGQLPPDQAQRMADQAGKPLEYTGPGGYQGSPQGGPTLSKKRQSKERRDVILQQQQMELNTQRLYKGAAEYAASKLRPPGPERDHQAEAALDNMNAALIRSEETINDVMTDKVDAQVIAESFSDNPAMAKMIAEGGVSKGRVASFLRTQLGHQQVSYMAASGKLPPGYDETNPVTRRFAARMNEVAAAFRQSNVLVGDKGIDTTQGDAFDKATLAQDTDALAGAWQGIKTVGERNDFLRKTTAQIMMESEFFRSQQENELKASGEAEKLMQAIQERDALRAENDELRQKNSLLGGGFTESTTTEMRQGMDEQGNPATPPVKVKKLGPADEARVKRMQEENAGPQYNSRAGAGQRAYQSRGGL